MLDEPFTRLSAGQAATACGQDPDEPGEPLARIRPRALLVPPGIPEFMTPRADGRRAAPRRLGGPRVVGPSPDRRAVDVSVDGGATWHAATLEPDELGQWAWRRLHVRLAAERARARTSSAAARATRPGTRSPLETAWNVGGYANNAVQRIAVTVR